MKNWISLHHYRNNPKYRFKIGDYIDGEVIVSIDIVNKLIYTMNHKYKIALSYDKKTLTIYEYE